MRTTLSVPDEYYSQIKASLKNQGYSTVNELLLDLIRHHFDAAPFPVPNPILKEIPKVIKTVEDIPKPTGNDFCKHGSAKGLCKFGCG